MTELLEPQRAALISEITTQFSDPAERFHKLDELGKLFASDIKRAKADVVEGLHEELSWSQVGATLGFSGSRAEQIAKGR